MAAAADIFGRFIVCDSRYVVHLNTHCSGSFGEADVQNVRRLGSDPNRRPDFELRKSSAAVHVDPDEERYRCEIFAGWGRWYWQGVLAHIPSEHYLPVIWRLRRLGVQPWYVSVDASIRDGQIRNLRLFSFVVGGRRSLGAEWELNENMPQRFIESSTTPDQSRTSIGGYSITSLPGGNGIHIAATPDSARRELQARHINQACLRSFNRCEELCQLLPDAISVLDDRGSHWADCAPGIH